ncbi:MAG: MFS transporter [Gammaproteobacteria bacterium]|nr:MFS transporter [Gammaproteobacteria bacterium]
MSNQTALKSCLSRREVLAYGFGDVSASLVWNAVSAFALLFYTDVALLPAAAIGTLFFISRIIDAGFDVGIGLAVDRTRTRWGRARPYLLFGAMPFGLFGLLTFYVPDLTTDGRFYYALFTYFILGLLLSVVTIPYSAMLPMMSQYPKDRIDLSAARSVATSLGVIVVTALFMPGVAYFGEGDQQRGFFIMGAIVSVVATAMLLYCFWQCQERVVITNTVPVNLRTDIVQMFRNRAWNVASGFALLNFIRFGALLSLTPYFAINVLKQPWMISVLLPTLSGTLLIGAFLARPVLTRLGLIKADTLALIAGFLCYAVLPFCEQSPWLFITLYVLSSLFISITMTSIYAMASEAVDFHQHYFGVRQEGLLAAGVSLAIKIGMAFGTAGVAYALAIADYDPTAVGESAISMMAWIYYGLPLAVFALQAGLIRYYPSSTLLSDSGR